nr:zinc-ribbon domain-containing protein [uncultured Roseococcus sp.]
MDIACPHCGATYRVPDSLADGRKAVRCVACMKSWVPQAAGALAATGQDWLSSAPLTAPPPSIDPVPAGPAPVDAPVTEAPGAISFSSASAPTRPEVAPSSATPPGLADRRLPETARRGGGSALSTAWAVSLALVIGGGAALWVYRAELAVLWPPFARLTG